MRHATPIGYILAVLTLAGCSQEYRAAEVQEGPQVTAVSVKEEAAGRESGGGEAERQGEIPVSLPKIAYVYDYGYRLDPTRISEVQQAHADLCEKQGPRVCRILEMQQSGGEGEYAAGSLTLAVAAPRARAFGARLAQVAKGSGGEQVSSAISGEDLSKQIVDTEARLRARTLLRDRLMEILKTRNGKVAELVEAERSVAQVNEEIDQARSWLAEMQGRVDYSRMNISYNSGSRASGGFMEPIRAAVGSVSTILGGIVAALILAVTILVPLGLIGFAIYWAARKLRSPAPTPAVQEQSAES